jgi:hypothetical protein
MRYKVGAERLRQIPSVLPRRHTAFPVASFAPVGPTHAVCARTGAVVCGINANALRVLNEDWETACFVEKCADCFAALTARSSEHDSQP